MDTPAENPSFAWQPFTSKGVAAFAPASFGRVLLVQLAFALLAAATLVWFLHTDWFPVISLAAERLPKEGAIRGGSLDYGGESPQRLADNRFLAFAVDLDHSGDVRSPAHLQVEMGRNDLEIFSLLGFVKFPYGRDWRAPINRQDVVPWWGAWAPPILGMAALAVIASLLLAWILLATLYSPVAWLVGFFANRDLDLGGSWRLAAAALMPGALVMVLGVSAYGLGLLELPGLAIVLAAHFVMHWAYLIAGVFAVSRHPEVAAARTNPFAPPPKSEG